MVMRPDYNSVSQRHKFRMSTWTAYCGIFTQEVCTADLMRFFFKSANKRYYYSFHFILMSGAAILDFEFGVAEDASTFRLKKWVFL